jgi:hypothetical protein
LIKYLLKRAATVTAENPDIMVWNLWSRKEAAYKNLQ